jgi:hypothetical protein
VLDALALVGVPGCFAAGWFELTRALGGREIAWVYTFEWPLYGIAGIYMWWRIRRGKNTVESRPARSRRAPRILRHRTQPAPDPNDPQLRAWQDYLARLHAADPPGGPPATG